MEERISQKPMTYEAGTYHVAVVGAGHAGIEAALACARLGLRTLCFTINLDAVGNMPCTPAIGGTGKGPLVRRGGRPPTWPASSTGCSTGARALRSTPSGPRRTGGNTRRL